MKICAAMSTVLLIFDRVVVAVVVSEPVSHVAHVSNSLLAFR